MIIVKSEVNPYPLILTPPPTVDARQMLLLMGDRCQIAILHFL